MIPTFIHNLKPQRADFFTEAEAWDWVRRCGAFCFNGNYADAVEIKYAMGKSPANAVYGASLVTYQNSRHPEDDTSKQLSSIRDRISFLADNLPRLDWVFTECELWSDYVLSHRDLIFQKHTDVINLLREKWPNVKIVAYKYGSTITTGWRLGFTEERLYSYKENVSSWSVPFYNPADLFTCRRQLDETVARSQAWGHRGGVVPWLGLGQQYVPVSTNRWEYRDCDYDTKYSWALSQFINKPAYRDPSSALAWGHWGQIPVVYLYRPHSEFFAKHIKAYLGILP